MAASGRNKQHPFIVVSIENGQASSALPCLTTKILADLPSFRCYSALGNWVVPRAAAWLTTRQPFKTQPHAFYCAIFLHGFIHIHRACWFKPAPGTQHWGDVALVKPEHSHYGFTGHYSSPAFNNFSLASKCSSDLSTFL